MPPTPTPAAAAGRSGAQLWMGSVPKRLDADQISRAFTALGAPAPIAVVLRRSTYRVDGVDDPVGFALVDFASATDAATALTLCEGASFQVPDASTTTTNPSGECVFHLRRAAETLRKKVDAYRHLDSMSGRDDASSDDVGGGGGVGLAAQLAPLEPETIRARLASMNIAVSPEDEMKWKDEGGHGLWRLRLVERLCAAHGEPIDDPSGNRTSDGTVPNVTPRVWTMADPANATAPIPADAIDRMVRCLEELGSEVTKGTKAHRRWPKAHRPDRAGVISSARYLSLTALPTAGARQRRKLERYRWVWDECEALLASVAGDEIAGRFDGLAVTHTVKGSPHVDAMDVAPQFACSLGDFTPTDNSDSQGKCPYGGCLCVETNFDAVAVIDTRNRMASVDGRKVHWVDPRYTGDRWSVVWYRRADDAAEPVVGNGVVERWWDRSEKTSWVHLSAADAFDNAEQQRNNKRHKGDGD